MLAQGPSIETLPLANPREHQRMRACVCTLRCRALRKAGPSGAAHPDLLVEPQAAAVEDEVAIVEAT